MLTHTHTKRERERELWQLKKKEKNIVYEGPQTVEKEKK